MVRTVGWLELVNIIKKINKLKMSLININDGIFLLVL